MQICHPGARGQCPGWQNTPCPPEGQFLPEDAAEHCLLCVPPCPGTTLCPPQDSGWSQGPGAPQELCVCVNSNVWKVFPEYLGINSIPSWHFPCPCHTAPGNAELLATPRNSPELLFCPVASREATELGQGLQSLLLPCQSSSTTSTSSRPRGWIRLGKCRGWGQEHPACPARVWSCQCTGQTKEISSGIGAGVKSDSHSEGIKLLFSPVLQHCRSRFKV